MSKQIRPCWVYRKNNRWWRYLPRRDDAHLKFNNEGEGSLDEFKEPMPCETPPKLWFAWIYRDFKEIPQDIKTLFGNNAKIGSMNIFKNTYSTNKALWKIKHAIELRPITFPNGEPTINDVQNVEILHDGRCIINPDLAPNPNNVQLIDSTKQFTKSYLSSRLISRDKRFKDVYEDNVYNPANISIID